MKQAVIYARVSSKDQEREGYSIPAQLKLLREYARTHEFEIVREFIDVETAKIPDRKQFGEMVRFFRENASCRVAIVEKTDRLYRNFRDCVTLEDLEIEIHLPKEGRVIGKDSKSQAKLVHGIQVAIARNYIENLREEVRKGMREKADRASIRAGRPSDTATTSSNIRLKLIPRRLRSRRACSLFTLQASTPSIACEGL
ncbi:MAG: recombinase family protein [Terriglobia bacterium]